MLRSTANILVKKLTSYLKVRTNTS